MLGLPEVKLTFAAAINRASNIGTTGRLAMVIRDAVQATGVQRYELTSPNGLAEQSVTAAAATTAAINMAFRGGIQSLVLVVCAPTAALADAYALLQLTRFDVCVVADLTAEETAAYVAWAKGLYDNDAKNALFVVAGGTAPDHPAIVWFDAADIVATDPANPDAAAATYTASAFAPRIAGAIAGMPLWEGVTFLQLPEVVSSAVLDKAALDAAIGAGKLALYYNGDNVKIARGVTSLVTLGTDYSVGFQKIKVMRIMNRVKDDIIRNIENNWIGRVPNTIEQKQLLASTVHDYLVSLEQLNVLQAGTSEMEIDVARQRAYLKTTLPAAQVDAMDDTAVLEAATGDQLFLLGRIQPIDAIESVDIVISL